MIPSRVPRYLVGLFLIYRAGSSGSQPFDTAILNAIGSTCLCLVMGLSYFVFSVSVSKFRFLFVLVFRCVLVADGPGRLSPKESSSGLLLAFVDKAESYSKLPAKYHWHRSLRSLNPLWHKSRKTA